MSILMLPLLTRSLCSRGSAGGASTGSAEEKDHSSSSFAGAGGAGLGCLDEKPEEARAAKGSTEAGLGGANADCATGLGVVDWERDGAELKPANCEKEEPGGGVGVDNGPLALLFCVIDERSAGPGTSVDWDS